MIWRVHETTLNNKHLVICVYYLEQNKRVWVQQHYFCLQGGDPSPDYESYLLIKRPLEERVTMSSHHHKKQRQVGATASPISIQVDPQAHLVAVFTGIKGWKT